MNTKFRCHSSPYMAHHAVCTRESTASDADYCIISGKANAVGTMIDQVLTGPCLGTDCSNSACNAAVQSVRLLY